MGLPVGTWSAWAATGSAAADSNLYLASTRCVSYFSSYSAKHVSVSRSLSSTFSPMSRGKYVSSKDIATPSAKRARRSHHQRPRRQCKVERDGFIGCHDALVE